MLHNALYEIGDRDAVHVNLPQFYDMALIPYPGTIVFDDTGGSLTYNGVVADLGTGTYKTYMFDTKPVDQIDLVLQTFDRRHYNRLLDFACDIEGRYQAFWATTMTEQFRLVGFAGGVWSGSEIDMIGGPGQREIYALNWGQARLWNDTKRLVLMFIDGYRTCVWNRILTVDQTVDPRVIKLTLAFDIPLVAIENVDVIAECIYARSNKDAVEIDYTVDANVTATMELVEDGKHYYDPWTEPPVVYPE